jgi:hypothetical protein
MAGESDGIGLDSRNGPQTDAFVKFFWGKILPCSEIGSCTFCTETFSIFQEILRAESDAGALMQFAFVKWRGHRSAIAITRWKQTWHSGSPE